MAKFKIFGTIIGQSPTVKKKSGDKSAGVRSSLFSGSVNGYKQLQKNLKITETQLQHAVAAAMFDEAVKVMDKSQKLVPVDTGDLQRSAVVKAPRTIKRPESSLSYNTVYALWQHEHHSSKSKYLENPMKESASGMDRRLKKGIKKHAAAGTKVGQLNDKRYG